MADAKPSYAQINRKVWNTAQFRGLSRDARELFFYLATCPHGNMIGIFVLRPGYALDDLQWGADRERYSKSLAELLAIGLIKYDPKNEIILDTEQIVKHPPINENVVKAAIKLINNLPNTPLFQDLKLLTESLGISYLKSLAELLGKRYANTITITVTETITVKGEVNAPAIPPDPTAREEEKPDPLFADLKTIIEAINEKLTPYNQRQVMMFVEANVKGKNHGAIIHCLRSLLKKLTTKQEGEEIKPRAYLEAALNGNDERAGEDGKHNAEDHEQQAQGKKGPATAAGLQAFGRIMAEIGRASP